MTDRTDETKAAHPASEGTEGGPARDAARHGGGIGTVERQPLDPSAQRRGETEPVIADPPPADAAGLAAAPDARPSGEDPDDTSDETLGTRP